MSYSMYGGSRLWEYPHSPSPPSKEGEDLPNKLEAILSIVKDSIKRYSSVEEASNRADSIFYSFNKKLSIECIVYEDGGRWDNDSYYCYTFWGELNIGKLLLVYAVFELDTDEFCGVIDTLYMGLKVNGDSHVISYHKEPFETLNQGVGIITEALTNQMKLVSEFFINLNTDDNSILPLKS